MLPRHCRSCCSACRRVHGSIRGPGGWPLLVSADLARALLLAVVPLAAFTGALSLPLLIAVAFLAAAWGTVFDVAFAGWVPRLVSGDRLHLANARVEQARSVAVVAGPGLGGVLVSLLSAPLALLADSVSFLASAVLVGAMRNREPAWPAPPAPRVSEGRSHRASGSWPSNPGSGDDRHRGHQQPHAINRHVRGHPVPGRCRPPVTGRNRRGVCHRQQRLHRRCRRRPPADRSAGYGAGHAVGRRPFRPVDAACSPSRRPSGWRRHSRPCSSPTAWASRSTP